MKALAEKQKNHSAPYINVTPLIDVLLVLLIIFMVVTPQKPSRFKTQIPQGPPPESLPPNPLALIVTIDKDLRLKLNQVDDMGSVNDTAKLSATLEQLFQERKENHAYNYELETPGELREEDRIQRTVFIKAPRSIHYGDVAKVIDGVKGAGATPIGLQIDDLD